MPEEFLPAQDPKPEELRQIEWRELIVNNAKKDAGEFMRQLCTDLSVEQINPGSFNFFDDNYAKATSFLRVLPHKFPQYSYDELNIYADEFFKECEAGYPKRIH
ncbi:MAG: hypothetical protein AAB729_01710 [Patescibacteria group bacterium]